MLGSSNGEALYIVARAKPTKLAREVLEFGERLRVGDGDLLGQPFQWLPFQRDWITRTFARLPNGSRPRRSYLSVARRNGKTATAAVLVLSSLLGPTRAPGSLIVSASRSREQASLVFRYCVKMLVASGLIGMVKVRDAAREIEEPLTGTKYRAISADATTALGMGPSLVVMDELGAVVGPHDRLFASLSTSMGSFKNSLFVVISTQSASDADLFSLLLDDAKDQNDPRTVVALHAADPEDDLYSPKTWKKANPALDVFRSREDLEQMADESKRLPARQAAFSNYCLNLRVSTDTPFMTKEVWDKCAGEPNEDILRAGPCFGGLDLSSRQDLTAFAIVAESADGKLHAKVWAWTPLETVGDRELRDRAPYSDWIRDGYLRTTPGTSIAYDILAREIADICGEYPMAAINYDRWRIHSLEEEFLKSGTVLPLTPCGQGFRDSAPGVAETIHAVLSEDLQHGGNPILQWNIANSVLELDSAGNGKISKRRSTGRVDLAVALAMAIKACRVDREGIGMVESEGLMFV
jgi:phage terminase large subunit-like protein